MSFKSFRFELSPGTLRRLLRLSAAGCDGWYAQRSSGTADNNQAAQMTFGQNDFANPQRSPLYT